MKLSIKNRIALYSVLSIASLSIVVFIAIFFTVKNIVYKEIDDKLEFEAKKHAVEIIQTKDSIYFAYKDEWLEREHMEVEIYPLFVQLFDADGNHLDKSPNLKSLSLEVATSNINPIIKNISLDQQAFRQIQIPLQENSVINGFISIAVPLGDAKLLIESLQRTLLIIYPILLIITFFTSRYISKITIKPITLIAETVDDINTNDLTKRVPKMGNGDEIETLSNAINALLDRIDVAIKRKRQFTADASHQLRTPLAVLKGNLEILIRKKRQPESYIEVIEKNITKIDEMTNAVDKLLILARLNSNPNQKIETEDVNIYNQIEKILTNYKQQILKNKLNISISNIKNSIVNCNKIYLALILDNLISNAIKYADHESEIKVSIKPLAKQLEVRVCNTGPKIPPAEINEIFNPFFRNTNHETKQEGYGLGLAIVAKAAELLNIKVEVSSNKLTCFTLTIPKKSQT
jgi:signal transduction histidine kinase